MLGNTTQSFIHGSQVLCKGGKIGSDRDVSWTVLEILVERQGAGAERNSGMITMSNGLLAPLRDDRMWQRKLLQSKRSRGRLAPVLSHPILYMFQLWGGWAFKGDLLGRYGGSEENQNNPLLCHPENLQPALPQIRLFEKNNTRFHVKEEHDCVRERPACLQYLWLYLALEGILISASLLNPALWLQKVVWTG